MSSSPSENSSSTVSPLNINISTSNNIRERLARSTAALKSIRVRFNSLTVRYNKLASDFNNLQAAHEVLIQNQKIQDEIRFWREESDF